MLFSFENIDFTVVADYFHVIIFNGTEIK